jgi:restriction endonuclease S subunit
LEELACNAKVNQLKREKERKLQHLQKLKNYGLVNPVESARRHLVEGDNWAPSRVKRHDYICSSCRSNKRKTATANKTSSSSGHYSSDVPNAI